MIYIYGVFMGYRKTIPEKYADEIKHRTLNILSNGKDVF